MSALKPRRRVKPDYSKPLNREKIAAAAIEIAREEGASALSMRKVAGLFGVDVAALYRHFKDKDELLAEVARLASETAGLELSADGPFEDRFLGLCEAIRDGIVQHPELGLYGGGSPWATPFIARAHGLLATLLCEAGLRGQELVFATQTALHVVTSVAQSESLTRATPAKDNRSFSRTILGHLPAEVLEVWQAPGPGAPSHGEFDAFFDFAVRAMLGAVVPKARREV